MTPDLELIDNNISNSETTINFNTPNSTIIEYIRGSGGKFLANCCALSNKAVLQDATFARLQLQFNDIDNYEILKNRFKLHSMRQAPWNDLSFGCGQLFGNKINDYDSEYNSVINQLTHSDYIFFRISHNRRNTIDWINEWPLTKIISFSGFDAIQTDENIKQLTVYWNNIRDISWPINPPATMDEFNKLESRIQYELNDFFDGEIYKFYYDMGLPNDNKQFIWDILWYKDENKLISEIENLYNFLGLPNFAEKKEYILSLYKLWCQYRGVLCE